MTARPDRSETLRCDSAGIERARLATASLVWEACRRITDRQAVHRALSDGADVAAAAAAAVEHRVGPLLWRALGEAEALGTLGDLRSWLAAVADVHRMEALLLLPRAVSVALEPLVEGGLEPVVWKGPAVAARYPEPGLRPMEDIDVLLPSVQHQRALALLAKAGWTVARSARRDRYDTVLVHSEAPSLSLELHYGLEPSYERTTALDATTLWDRREPIDCLGTPVFGFPLAEELVVLAAHAGKPYHGFDRLIWIADLAMVVGSQAEQGSEVDWERVRSVAEEGRCVTVVSAALGLARHAGVSFPRGLFPMPEKGWRGAALQHLLDPSWPVAARTLPTFHLRFALTDGWWRRTRLLLGTNHGKTFARRVRWTLNVPAEALVRWQALRFARHADRVHGDGDGQSA